MINKALFNKLINMKKYLVGLIIFYTLSLHSQILSGKVVYNIQAPDIERTSNDSKYRMIDKLIIDNVRKQTFLLEFNKNISSFVRKGKLDGSTRIEKNIDNIASLLVTTSENCFIDQNAENYILQTKEGILIRKPFKPLNWEILTESKMVDNYLCYKALYTQKIINMKGEEKDILITAWFAPSLPFSYGPKEFYGLPGLILELEEKKTIFYATEISLFESKKEIEFPKGKTITESEYSKAVMAQ